MDSGLVSTVIPTFNYGQYVGDAVKSALAQTYKNMEVIVVDDGSTDDTRQRLQPYMNRIRYVHQANRGLPAARNTGIRHARGQWVALLDADDLWHCQKTEVQLEAAAKIADVALIGSRAAEQLPLQLPRNPTVTHLSVREFLCSTPMGPSSVLIQRHCLESAGLFDEKMRSAEDRDMWLRLAARYPCAQVDSPCWWYRVHEGQMMRRSRVMYENYRAVLDKFFRRYPEHQELEDLAYCHLYLDACMSFGDDGQRWAAAGFLLRSWWRRPWLRCTPGGPGRWWRPKMLVRLAIGDRLCQTLRASGVMGLRRQ